MAHVTFIHGIANKPASDALLNLWERSLAREDGLDLATEGVTTSMVYWADVMYEAPLAPTGTIEESAAALAGATDLEAVDGSWRQQLESDEAAFVYSLEGRFGGDLGDEPVPSPEQIEVELEALSLEALSDEVAPQEGEATHQVSPLERVPLPWFLKRPIMERFLRDVHHYLFNAESTPRQGETFRVQDEIRQRMVEALKQGAQQPGPHIIVSHSMGTVVAYDCLRRVPECPAVDGIMTIGSPLGIDEIQDKFAPEWSRDDGFPQEKVRGAWINVYDRWDPVAGFDARLANDYKRRGRRTIEDIHEPNWGRWRHDISKYLRGNLLRKGLQQLLQL